MSTNVLIMLLTGSFILLVLLNGTVRKAAALLLVIILAFGLGLFWPRPRVASGLMSVQAKVPCVSSL